MSGDNYLTVEMFQSGIAEIRGEIRRGHEELHAEIAALDKKIEINASKIEELHYFIGWGFAIMAVVIALVGFVITLAPMFREIYKDARNNILREHVRELMRDEIDAAVSRAISEKTRA